jgi:hypothetical protein
MAKCKKCGQKDGVHKMSCESRKQVVVEPEFLNKEDEKHWGFGEDAFFRMLNNIVNGKLKK